MTKQKQDGLKMSTSCSSNSKSISKKTKGSKTSKKEAEEEFKDFDTSIINDSVHKKALDIVARKSNNCFYIINLESVRDRIRQWHEYLPKVHMHYAVKSNPDEMILREVIKSGNGFDVASKNEIQMVLELGAKPQDLIFANSVKQTSHIEFAKEKGVKLMTFDSVEEAISIHSVYPEAELILRIGVVETNAFCPMGQKFGAPEVIWIPILNTCKKLKMRVRGVSFHVGSGGCDFEAY
jgi:ornithine decarboxylase